MIHPRSSLVCPVRTTGLFAAVLLLLWYRLLGVRGRSVADYLTGDGRPARGDPHGSVTFAPLPRPSYRSASREKWGVALTGG